MLKLKYIEGNIADLDGEKFFPGRILIKHGKILRVERVAQKFRNYILPGFIDSHCHIESSFLSPALFASLAVRHGTVGAVADCHEIANVLGKGGILWMLKAATLTPFRFSWALPSCVPATPFETTPHKIGAKETKELLKRKEFVALGEMMNFPGVISGDKEVLAKIKIAKALKKPIDGHCPGLSGKDLGKYIKAGISTDHECVSLEEAKEKQKLGLFVQIREGSAAKNLENLIGLNYEKCLLVTDDLEVKDLLRGQLNEVIKKAVKLGVPFFKAVRMATVLPAQHYGLNLGEIKAGKEADLVEFQDLASLKPRRVWIEGELVFERDKVLFPIKKLDLKTDIKVGSKMASDFEIGRQTGRARVIEIVPGQIITRERLVDLEKEKDILKIAVVNRYGKEYLGLGFVKGFGLQRGALASSVSHDSHNLICAGTNDEDMAKAVNILRRRGGFVFANKNKISKVELPLAGLMSNEDPTSLVKKFEKLDGELKAAGCQLKNPLSQLSFLALLVIPELKISDRGLFDVKEFGFVELFDRS